LLAAAADISSPSGVAILWKAVAAAQIGEYIYFPMNSILVSTSSSSTSALCFNLSSLKAYTPEVKVTSAFAPDL